MHRVTTHLVVLSMALTACGSGSDSSPPTSDSVEASQRVGAQASRSDAPGGLSPAEVRARFDDLGSAEKEKLDEYFDISPLELDDAVRYHPAGMPTVTMLVLAAVGAAGAVTATLAGRENARERNLQAREMEREVQGINFSKRSLENDNVSATTWDAE